MKSIRSIGSTLLLIFFMLGSRLSTGQSNSSSTIDLSPSFIAIIVPQVDSAAQWYVDNLGFEIFKENEYPEYGVKAKFLQKGNFQIEMFQHKDAVDPNVHIPDDQNKMLKIGLFKYGFLTKDAEKLLEELKQKNVPIYREMYVDEAFGYKYFFVRDYSGNIIQLFEKL